MAPSLETVPTDGFSPYKPARQAGSTMEPSVSDPTLIGAKPAATPAALPDEDPDGVCDDYSANEVLRRGGSSLTLWPRNVSLRLTPPRTYGD